MLARVLIRIVLVVILLMVLQARVGDAQSEVTITLDSLTLAVGESGVVAARIDCPIEGGCAAFDVTVRYDPTIIRVDSAEFGPYLGTLIVPVVNAVDSNAGTVQIAAAAMGAQIEFGEPILFYLRITGLVPGLTTLTVARLEIADEEGNPVVAGDIAGAISITSGALVTTATPTPRPTVTLVTTATPTPRPTVTLNPNVVSPTPDPRLSPTPTLTVDEHMQVIAQTDGIILDTGATFYFRNDDERTFNRVELPQGVPVLVLSYENVTLRLLTEDTLREVVVLDGLFAGRLGWIAVSALENATPVTPFVVVTWDVAVNVRSSDSNFAAVIAQMSPGERAIIRGVSALGSGLYAIELENGTTGWIAPGVVEVYGDTDGLPPLLSPWVPTPSIG